MKKIFIVMISLLFCLFIQACQGLNLPSYKLEYIYDDAKSKDNGANILILPTTVGYYAKVDQEFEKAKIRVNFGSYTTWDALEELEMKKEAERKKGNAIPTTWEANARFYILAYNKAVIQDYDTLLEEAYEKMWSLDIGDDYHDSKYTIYDILAYEQFFDKTYNNRNNIDVIYGKIFIRHEMEISFDDNLFIDNEGTIVISFFNVAKYDRSPDGIESANVEIKYEIIDDRIIFSTASSDAVTTPIAYN